MYAWEGGRCRVPPWPGFRERANRPDPHPGFVILTAGIVLAPVNNPYFTSISNGTAGRLSAL